MVCLIQWFREHGYLRNGKYNSLEDFLRAEWETAFLDWDANDVLTLLQTWSSGDISRVQAVGPHLQGDLSGVLGRIQAKGLVMPCKTDLYFTVSRLLEAPSFVFL